MVWRKKPDFSDYPDSLQAREENAKRYEVSMSQASPSNSYGFRAELQSSDVARELKQSQRPASHQDVEKSAVTNENANTQFATLNQRIDDLFGSMNKISDERFEAVKVQFGSVNSRIDDMAKHIDKRFDNIEKLSDERFEAVKVLFGSVNSRIDDMEKHTAEHFEMVNQQVGAINSRLDGLEKRTTEQFSKIEERLRPLENVESRLVIKLSGVLIGLLTLFFAVLRYSLK